MENKSSFIQIYFHINDVYTGKQTLATSVKIKKHGAKRMQWRKELTAPPAQRNRPFSI